MTTRVEEVMEVVCSGEWVVDLADAKVLVEEIQRLRKERAMYSESYQQELGEIRSINFNSRANTAVRISQMKQEIEGLRARVVAPGSKVLLESAHRSLEKASVAVEEAAMAVRKVLT